MRVLGVITARGGSKGIARKNLANLHGKPLLTYTADAALGAKRLDRVILSTEDEEIAQTGRDAGVEVPFMRPRELASDEAPTLPVLQHAVQWVEQSGDYFDAICLLQPTTPLRRAEDIDACVSLLERTGADAVVTVLPVPSDFNPHWVYSVDEDGYLRIATGEDSPIPRRQELPAAYHREGSVYVTRRDVLVEGNSLYGKRLVGQLVDQGHSVNIDTPEDLARAESMIATLKKEPNSSANRRLLSLRSNSLRLSTSRRTRNDG